MIVFALSVNPPAYSQPLADPQQLLKEYVTALKTSDDRAIDAAWTNINADPGTREFIKENYPNQYTSYELWALKRRAERLRGTSPLTIPTTATTARSSLPSDRPASDPGRLEANQVRAADSHASKENSIQRLRPNSRLSSESSNRNRQSNQDRLRSFR